MKIIKNKLYRLLLNNAGSIVSPAHIYSLEGFIFDTSLPRYSILWEYKNIGHRISLISFIESPISSDTNRFVNYDSRLQRLTTLKLRGE